MTLTLHFHPLSSFCQKVLIGLYELGVPFEKEFVDLGNAEHRARFLTLWPIGKFPVLRDDVSGLTVPESTTILEYVDERFRDKTRLVPADPNDAIEGRLQDRFYDLYVNMPVGKITTDKFRPEGQHDSFGVAQARAQIETAYEIAEARLGRSTWAGGNDFSIADCAAAPALFYSGKIVPFGNRPNLSAYYERVVSRPSVRRTFDEAAPYLHLFPG